jgi:hypothetical protein
MGLARECTQKWSRTVASSPTWGWAWTHPGPMWTRSRPAPTWGWAWTWTRPSPTWRWMRSRPDPKGGWAWMRPGPTWSWTRSWPDSTWGWGRMRPDPTWGGFSQPPLNFKLGAAKDIIPPRVMTFARYLLNEIDLRNHNASYINLCNKTTNKIICQKSNPQNQYQN